MELETVLKLYNYNFPANLIAQEPSSPRDSAKLLVFNRKTDELNHDTFLNLIKYLPKNAVLVFNKTKVIPARLTIIKPTSGQARLLYISHNSKQIKVLSDRKLALKSKLTLWSKTPLDHTFKVIKKDGKFYYLKPSFPLSKTFEILEKFGDMPIPPYIKNSPLTRSELKEKYQTVFAKEKGSVAAPTASLHFSNRLIKKIKASGIDITYVTLHVNLGTFSPLTENQLKTKKLHSEWYEIDKKTMSFLKKSKKQGRPIIAVGTTVVRTLESYKKLSGNTDLFISPGYRFKVIDGIITNFHVPKSSLLMLVSAFTGREKLLHLYRRAIKKQYKLFSFGDGMLIL